MIVMLLGAVLFITSGTLTGLSDCWDYLKALKANQRHEEE